jgi:type II secretory pathway pseudopilin PulG
MAPFNQHPNQCVDPNEFFDFGQMPSPTQPTTLKRESSATSTMASPTSTNIDDELQTPAKPSHEYERFKQQTGLPSGSLAGLNAGYNTGFPMFSSTGLDEMAMMGGDSIMDGAWNTGLPMDVGMNMGVDYRQNSFVFNEASDDYVDPSAITQEEVTNVRVWPGMHQQQAAMAKAQAQAQQQRAQQLAHQKQQQAMQQQQQQQQQQQNRMPSTSSASRKTSSPLSDAHTEEMITRVVAQIRADSQNASASMQNDNQGLLPHIIRAKKDEEDMDEDERLLASEEGKKLSSKERRQLRNKVSARAFRSRRKEYIGQLEGEVAMKVNEANELRAQNRLLMEENARSRAFIERLLRHQAFTPFLEELSRDESLQSKAPMTSMPSTATPVTTAPAPTQFQQQQFNGMSQAENTHVGMTMVPEPQIDFAMLNLNNNNNGNNWGANNGFNFQQPVAFAVTELPEGPSNPLDIEAMSGKGYSAILNAEDDSPVEEVKADYPVIERPIQSESAVAHEAEEEDAEYDLYYSSAPSAASSAPLEDQEALFTNPEKAFAHYSLVISDESNEARLAERLERKIAAMSPVMQRIADITSMFDS